MKQQNRLYRPSILHGLALALLFFFLVMGFVPKTQAAPMAPDYTITTLGGVLVVTDVSGNGETLTVSEPGGGNILFSVPGRNFSIDGGPDLPGNSGSLSLAGVTSVIINPGNGNDTLNVGAFTGSFPSLTINGDAGNDTINLNGDITFATDANLDLDLQNDSATPGTDVVNLGAGVNLLTAGSGTITIKCNWNVTLASDSSLETEDGGVTIETNQQAVVTAGTFVGIDLNNATIRTTGVGNVSLLGESGNTLDSNMGIRLQAGAQVLSTQATSGAGSLTFNGVIPGGRAANFGVQLTGAATLVSSVSGPITVTGLSGGTGGTGGNYGVVMADGATIRSTGTTAAAAPITVTGTGGRGNQTNHGVYLDGSASDPLITSVAGAISVTGTGGTATGPALVGFC